MKPSRMLELLKQWKSIQSRRKELDYDESRWCAELRSEFPSGQVGDRAFTKWLATEIDLPAERSAECLNRAAAFAIVGDQSEWNDLGGYVQIGKLVPLDKRERVAVIGAAKASGYRISTVIRQRESKSVMHHATPDIVVMAEFIESLPDAPDELRNMARKYIRAKALKVA